MKNKDLQKRMYNIVRKWKESDLLKSEFCMMNKITVHQLRYWLEKYDNDNNSTVSSKKHFINLPTDTLNSRNTDLTTVEILYPNGIKINVDENISESFLIKLLNI
jgi:hypothetical protein